MRLPVELILIIVEDAAQQEIRRDRAWVASLALVCHSVRALVEPILYHTIEMLHWNECSWSNPAFAVHTRALAIRTQNCQCRYSGRRFTSALTNVEILACDVSHFYDIYYNATKLPNGGTSGAVILPNLKALLFTSTFSGPRLAEIRRSVAAGHTFASITHLAMPLSFNIGWLLKYSALRLTHVLLALDMWTTSFTQAIVEYLARLVVQFAELDTLVRIVCVTPLNRSGQNREVRDAVRAALGRVATTRRDSRIALEDGTDAESLADLFVGYARRGYDAWNIGVALHSDLESLPREEACVHGAYLNRCRVP